MKDTSIISRSLIIMTFIRVPLVVERSLGNNYKIQLSISFGEKKRKERKEMKTCKRLGTMKTMEQKHEQEVTAAIILTCELRSRSYRASSRLPIPCPSITCCHKLRDCGSQHAEVSDRAYDHFQLATMLLLPQGLNHQSSPRFRR